MKEYTRKQTTVQAEQFLGQEIPGIRVVKNKIHYSFDKRFFYPSNVNARAWLSIEKVDGEGGPKYESRPFAFYEIKSHPLTEELNESNKHLVDLYCEVYQLNQPSVVAYIDRSTPKKVNYTDWVVHTGKGNLEIYTHAEFIESFWDLNPEKKELRCCGRCDGHNDICVADRFCEAHNVQGCEECFGKR